MELIVKGILAGVLGTLMMDFLNYLFARIGVGMALAVALA